jgi:hypothetical protein
VHRTTQQVLKQVKSDCAALDAAITQRLAADAAAREANARRRLQGAGLVAAALLAAALLGWALAAHAAGAVCDAGARGGAAGGGGGSGSGSAGGVCSSRTGQVLLAWHDLLYAHDGGGGGSGSTQPGQEGVAALTTVVGGLLGALLVCGAGAGWSWRAAAPVLDKRGLKRMDQYRAAVARARAQADVLYEEYFASIGDADRLG